MSENKIKKQQYERIGTIDVDKVLPFIEQYMDSKEKIRIDIDGYFVNVSSHRLKTFFLHGTNCSCCENKASFFAVERSTGTNSPYHINLYDYDKDGAEILFTHDYILARGLGGSDTIDNTRTSCGPCNWKKGKLEHLIKHTTDENEKNILEEQLKQFLPNHLKNTFKIK